MAGFAYVKVLLGVSLKKATVPIHNIEDFNVNNFDERRKEDTEKVYRITLENGVRTKGNVLKCAETEEVLNKLVEDKRPRDPKCNLSAYNLTLLENEAEPVQSEIENYENKVVHEIKDKDQLQKDAKDKIAKSMIERKMILMQSRKALTDASTSQPNKTDDLRTELKVLINRTKVNTVNRKLFPEEHTVDRVGGQKTSACDRCIEKEKTIIALNKSLDEKDDRLKLQDQFLLMQSCQPCTVKSCEIEKLKRENENLSSEVAYLRSVLQGYPTDRTTMSPEMADVLNIAVSTNMNEENPIYRACSSPFLSSENRWEIPRRSPPVSPITGGNEKKENRVLSILDRKQTAEHDLQDHQTNEAENQKENNRIVSVRSHNKENIENNKQPSKISCGQLQEGDPEELLEKQMFLETKSGRFHTKNGHFIPADQWKNLKQNSSLPNLIRKMVSWMWTEEELSVRFLDTSKTSVVGKRLLTPKKVNIIIDRYMRYKIPENKRKAMKAQQKQEKIKDIRNAISNKLNDVHKSKLRKRKVSPTATSSEVEDKRKKTMEAELN